MNRILTKKTNMLLIAAVLFASIAFLPACEMEDEVIDFDDEEEIDVEGAMGLDGMDQFLPIFDPGFKFGQTIGYDCSSPGMCTCKAGKDCENLKKSGKCKGRIEYDGFGDGLCAT